MNISLLITRSIAFMVIASVLALVGQERAIARSAPKPSAEGLQYLDQQLRTPALKNSQLKDPAALEKLRQYRKAWSKQYPAIAPLLGEWSDGIEGSFGIYPSSKSGEVCLSVPFSGKIQPGFIQGNTISYYDGNQGYDAMSIIYNLGREKVMGVKFTQNPDSKLIPFFAYPPAIPSSQRAQRFEAEGCQVAPPETQVADDRSAQSIANLPDGTYFYGQAPEINQIGKMYYLFKKRNDQVTGVVYAPRSEATCFTGEIQNDQVKRITIAFASYDRTGKNANWSSNSARDYDLSKAYRLNPKQYGGNASADIGDCQSGFAQLLGSAQSENGSDTYPSASTIKAALEAARTKRKSCLSNDPRGRGCFPSIDDIPKTDQTIKNAWAKIDPQVARFLGSWYVDMEFLPQIYPSTVKGQVCVITHGDATVFGVGRVTGKSLRYQDKVAYSMDGYANRSSQPPYELNFFGNPGLLAFHSTNRSDSLSVAISKSSEIKPLDEWGNRFKTLFEEAGCTTGLPEGTIATKPTEQLKPIAPSGSYAYPSPEEFAQFKKGLKSSPVTLSAADLKARQDFQAVWEKKNRAIAPYIGAWKTADNQDVYVFPSKVAGRVCVLRQKDGQLSPDLGVSMTTDMRYDGNNGMFKVDLPDVVAGRSGKTQPLSALYGAIGSPDVSSVKGELEQAQCVTELPKGGAIVAKKDPVVKPIVVKNPIEVPKPEVEPFKLPRSGAAPDNPVDFVACVEKNPYQSTREFLLKCLSGNLWETPKRADLRGYNRGE